MSNQKQTFAQGVTSGEQWDEAKLEEALKSLKDLHIKASYFPLSIVSETVLTGPSQMRELRSTIPRLHERLGTSKVGEATQAALNEIDEYKKLATSPENAKILERAKQSRKNNPKGIKPWRPSDEPDWLDPST